MILQQASPTSTTILRTLLGCPDKSSEDLQPQRGSKGVHCIDSPVERGPEEVQTGPQPDGGHNQESGQPQDEER